MKKVLHYVSIMNRGGQETFIMNVFHAINREHVLFDFLCTINQPGDYDVEINKLNGKIFHLNLGKFKIEVIDRFLNLRKFLNLHKNEYGVFHVHTQHAMDGFLNATAAIKAGIPTVIVHSHSTNTLYHPIAHKIFRPLLRRLPVTKFACSDLAGKWLYGRQGEYKIICNGVDIKRFSFSNEIRQQIRRENKWDNHKVIGHVGSFSYPKNHEFIVKVFNEIAKKDSTAILVLIGIGEMINDVKKQVEELGISDKVQFLGKRSDVYKLDQGFDLFLFPSRYEGLPVVLVEAQCTGLKCLVSDTITSEIDVTENIYRESLINSPVIWADTAIKIMEENTSRRNMADVVTNAGYNIKDTAKILTEFYCK